MIVDFFGDRWAQPVRPPPSLVPLFRSNRFRGTCTTNRQVHAQDTSYCARSLLERMEEWLNRLWTINNEYREIVSDICLALVDIYLDSNDPPTRRLLIEDLVSRSYLFFQLAIVRFQMRCNCQYFSTIAKGNFFFSCRSIQKRELQMRSSKAVRADVTRPKRPRTHARCHLCRCKYGHVATVISA